MPRAGDLNRTARGSNDVHSPLRGQLDYTGIGMTAGVGGNMIVAGIQGAFGEVFGLVKALTGIDLTPILDIFGTFTTNPATGQPNGILGRSVTDPVTGAVTNGVGGLDLTSLAAPFESVLGSAPIVGPIATILFDALTGGLLGGIIPAGTGTLPDITSVFGDLFGFLGLAADPLGALFGLGGLGSGSFDPIAAAESFITSVLNPTGLLASIPALFDSLTGGLLGGIIPGGTGTLGDLTGVFGDLFGFLGLTGDTTGGLFGLGGLGGGTFDPIAAAESFVTDILNPTGLLASIPAIVEAFIPGLSGGSLSNLSTWATDLTDVLGVVGLGTGAVSLLDNIQLLGPLLNPWLSFLSGGTTTTGTPADLTGMLTNIPLIPDLLNGLTGSPTGTLTDLVNVLQQLGIGFADLVASFIPGFSGGTQTDFNNIAGNLLSMLGNPGGLLTGGGGFDPISAIQQFASLVGVPAGLLSSNSLLPLHTMGGLTASSSGGTNALVNADPGFSDPTRFNGLTLWTLDTTLDHTGVAGSGSAKFVANGVPGQLISVPITVNPGKSIMLGAYAHWSGISALTGNAVMLSVNAYDAHDVLIPDPTHRVVSAVATPGAGSAGFSHVDAVNPANTLTADANGWVYLTGSYITPAGTSYVCLCLEVGSNVSTGQVNFDDIALYPPGLVDATLLHNFENMVPGIIPGGALQGFQGLVDIFGSFGHLFDGLGSAMSLSPQSGLSFSDLFGLAQGSSSNALDALTQGIINSNILNFRQNKTSGNGANNTTEAMLPLAHFGAAGALTTTAVPAGTAIMQRFNPAEVSQKGFVEFLGAIPAGTAGGVFMNIFKWSGTQWNSVWSSSDITSQLTTAIADVTRVLIPSGSQPTMNAGETYMIGLANNTASTLTVATKSTGVPNNSHETIPNFAATRTLAASGGAAPASVANSALTYNGNVPFIGVGILNVPANYVPPQTFPFEVAGPFTFAIPTWARVAGAALDVVGLGPGGGGQANYGTLTWWTGGNGGGFVTQRLVCGVDYPVGATTITGVVGTKGLAAGAYWNNGHKGTDTTITWNDGATNHTITGPAGDGGGNGSTSGTNGKSPGQIVFQGQIYDGGAAVGGNATGNPPGGGGGGAGPYQTGGDGADGKVWIRASQP